MTRVNQLYLYDVHVERISEACFVIAISKRMRRGFPGSIRFTSGPTYAFESNVRDFFSYRSRIMKTL